MCMEEQCIDHQIIVCQNHIKQNLISKDATEKHKIILFKNANFENE